MPTYTSDKDLEALGNHIIKTSRPGLAHVRIAYMFRDEAAISDDHVIAGMAIRVDDRNHTLHGFDFVIEIAKDVWDAASQDFRLALLDHELGHIGVKKDENNEEMVDEKTGRLKTYSRRHDIEEFEDVLVRHGAYHKKLREFLEAFAKHKRKEKKGATKKATGKDDTEDMSL